MAEMAIMGTNGDTRIIWDPTREFEVQQARETFDKFKKQRYLAYTVPEGGGAGKVIHEFDPEAGKMVLQPQMRGG